MSRYTHPHPMLNRVIQYGALVVAILMVASAPLQIALTLLGAPGGLFILSAIFTVLLAAPVLMLTAYAPAVTVDKSGLTLHPAVWKERFIAWDAVQAVKVYPLLPTQDQEITRRFTVGRRNYRPADGIMLVIPGLPPQYRIAGFFVGERSRPIVVLTNRAHRDYDRLLRQILEYTNSSVHDDALFTSSDDDH